MIAWLVAGLIVARWAVSLWLSQLNRGHVLANANAVPEPFSGVIDEPTYAKSVSYTLAKNRFARLAMTYNLVVLLTVLFSGVLPAVYELTLRSVGSSSWALALFIMSIGLGFALLAMPVGWLAQFRLEDRFGFNLSTQSTWWLDAAKRMLLAILLGYPLLVAILELAQRSGATWWLWSWGTVMAFQLVVAVLAPVLILPLFNKLTPLPEGTLQNRLIALAERTRFRARSIHVMDGSRRSRHSNAFFTGFGRFRKIVLFDTLIEHTDEAELEAVLAHEIGHSKKRHVPRLLLGSAAGSLAGFWVLGWIAGRPEFADAFGFSSRPGTRFVGANLTPTLLLFGLLAGTVTFWINPLMNWISRRFEYQADAFAAEVLGDSAAMIGALTKLSETNLSNLTPHPIYSRFHYSHPTPLERVAALDR